jgi:hypothetical protein
LDVHRERAGGIEPDTEVASARRCSGRTSGSLLRRRLGSCFSRLFLGGLFLRGFPLGGSLFGGRVAQTLDLRFELGLLSFLLLGDLLLGDLLLSNLLGRQLF